MVQIEKIHILFEVSNLIHRGTTNSFPTVYQSFLGKDKMPLLKGHRLDTKFLCKIGRKSVKKNEPLTGYYFASRWARDLIFFLLSF